MDNSVKSKSERKVDSMPMFRGLTLKPSANAPLKTTHAAPEHNVVIVVQFKNNI
jgi:hypothetical protein